LTKKTIRMFTTSILKFSTKRQLYIKKHSCIFTYLNFTCQLSIKKKVALQGFSKNIKISIQLWKWMPTLIMKNCTKKIDIIFKVSSFFVCFFWKLQIFIEELFFGLFYHAFRDIFYFFFISFIFIFFSSCLFVFVYEWWRKFLFFLLGIWSWKTQKLQVSCVYAHILWLDF
jgi:hypothetical protein